jgi:2-keto-3-deoxy-L-rhamnonate aldolase RhmA
MSSNLKMNRILVSLKNGGVPIGMQVSTASPAIIEVLAYTGFDYAMLDMEHTRIGLETMEHCVRAADASGITPIVRIAGFNADLIRQAIEAGAQGVMIPNVKTADTARAAVQALRYPPEGTCGVCPAIRAANFSLSGWDEYLAHANNQNMVIPLLEGKEAIKNAEAIFAELKPGVDAVGFGRGDLAQSLAEAGKKVNWDHPYLLEAFEKVLDISRKTGIPVIAFPSPTTPEQARIIIEKGARIILYSVDLLLFHGLCSTIIEGMKDCRLTKTLKGGM